MASTAGSSSSQSADPDSTPHTTVSQASLSAEFQPYVKPEDSRREFTFRAIFFGCIFGILFGAVTVYVGLRAGLTVAASIPIAVLSISVLRALGRASILENNIVQTTGNAGQSIAAGVIFTLPALIFLGFDLEYSRIFFLALLGGWLGVFFMIPLRRELIVKEHGNLTYPEGTACADVLLAGEHGGSFASRVFWGLGLGGCLHAVSEWKSVQRLAQHSRITNPSGCRARPFAPMPHQSISESDTLSVRASQGYLFAGGVFSWLVLMPAIHFFGSHFPGRHLSRQRSRSRRCLPAICGRRTCVRWARARWRQQGILTLLRTLPTIVGAFREGIVSIGKSRAAAAAKNARTATSP